MKKPNIAENVSEDIYDQLPIENFGKQMLYNMGWKDNQPIGKESKGPLNPVEFKPRNFRLGLGAAALEDDKHVKRYKEENKKSLYGTRIYIKGGRHKGLKAKIVEKTMQDFDTYAKENPQITVELKVNKQVVKVECVHVKLRSKSKSRSRSKSKSLTRTKEMKRIKLTWAYKGLIVRIINKQSNYYNTKAKIEDILDPYSFSLLTHDKVLHTNFTEDDIETVIPKINDDIMILVKEHKGKKAKLLERDKIKNKVIVQLYDDLNLLELTQDDVCQYSN